MMETVWKLIGALAGFGVMLIAARQAGHWAARFRFPLITGYLFAGVLMGPFGIGVLEKAELGRLSFINQLALAFIAFAAGSELRLSELKERWKNVAWMTAGLVATTFTLCAVAVFLLLGWIPFLGELSAPARVAAAILAGSILVARSPSSAIAVVNELSAKGPFTQTMLGVTVIMDVVVVVLFGISSEVANSLLRSPEFDIGFFVLIVAEVLLSATAGCALGFAIASVMRMRSPRWLTAIVLLAVGWGVFSAAEWIRRSTGDYWGVEILLEPLLICMTAGFVVSNATRWWKEFGEVLIRAGPPVYLAFFTLTGASLALDVLKDAWAVALALAFTRLVAIVLGSRAGGTMAGEAPQRKRLGWMGYVTQAGIGLGLATEAGAEFPEFGAAFTTALIAVIILNQVIGPPLLKAAIHRTGEANQKAVEEKPRHWAVIFGFEEQSLSLARLLRRHHWRVTIVFRREGLTEENETPSGAELRSVVELNEASLRELKISEADAIVSLLSDEESARVFELADRLAPNAHRVARLRSRSQSARLRERGAAVVDPGTAMVQLMEQFVRTPSAAAMLLGEEEAHQIEEIEVQNPAWHGVLVRDVRLPLDCLILSMERDSRTLVVHGFSHLELGDRLTVAGSSDSLQTLAQRLRS